MRSPSWPGTTPTRTPPHRRAVEVVVEGLPSAAARVLLKHYRIDERHSNAYTAWKEMGSPQNPTPDQYARLSPPGSCRCSKAAVALDRRGSARVEFSLPRQACRC